MAGPLNPVRPEMKSPLSGVWCSRASAGLGWCEGALRPVTIRSFNITNIALGVGGSRCRIEDPYRRHGWSLRSMMGTLHALEGARVSRRRREGDLPVDRGWMTPLSKRDRSGGSSPCWRRQWLPDAGDIDGRRALDRLWMKLTISRIPAPPLPVAPTIRRRASVDRLSGAPD